MSQNYLFCSLCMILLEEIPRLSQGDVFLCVRLQRYEPNVISMQKKGLHFFLRHWRAKVMQVTLKLKLLYLKRTFH
jgi:hypothetical protein